MLQQKLIKKNLNKTKSCLLGCDRVEMWGSWDMLLWGPCLHDDRTAPVEAPMGVGGRSFNY